jgi:hypothetical protein
MFPTSHFSGNVNSCADDCIFPFYPADKFCLEEAVFTANRPTACRGEVRHAAKFSSGSKQLVFMKPRTGARGEQCEVISREDVETHFSPERADLFVFEKLLTNHKDVQAVLGEGHPLVTERVYSKRYLEGQQEIRAALLVSDNLTSNSKHATAHLIDAESGRVQLRHGPGTTSVIKVPFYRRILEATRWLHDQTPEMPFLAYDFAVCDDGVYFIEVNVLCTYSKYTREIGEFYSVDEVNTWLKNDSLKPTPQERPKED